MQIAASMEKPTEPAFPPDPLNPPDSQFAQAATGFTLSERREPGEIRNPGPTVPCGGRSRFKLIFESSKGAAIHDSIRETRIVFLVDSSNWDRLSDELSVRSADFVEYASDDGVIVREYWGTTREGIEWRIHLRGS